MNEQLNNIIKRMAPCEYELNSNSDLFIDLGFDSFKIVSLFIEIENEYNIAFDDSDLNISKIRIVKDLETLLNKYL